MKNAMKENLSAKKEASVVVMTREAKRNLSVAARENHSVAMTVKTENRSAVAIRSLSAEETMTKEVKENLLVKDPKENRSAIKNRSENVLTVRKNAQ